MTLRLLLLDGNRHQDFSRSTPSALARLDTIDECLVNLHVATEKLTVRTHHRCSEPVKHRPSGLVGAESEYPLQSKGRNVVLLWGQVPRGSKSDGESGTGALENNAGCLRGLLSAGTAPPCRPSHLPTLIVTAVQAPESFGPPQPVQVVQACGIIGKPRTHLCIRGWIAKACLQPVHRLSQGTPYGLALKLDCLLW